MAVSIPPLPRLVRASGLLHGSNSDFVTNAYLALQHQWPDEGGYSHYMHVLTQPGGQRATVLREIAASDNARQCGVQFVDDLPADHVFQPEEHDALRLTSTSASLRISRTASDVEDLRRAIGRLTTDELSRAVEVVARAQASHQGALESRLNSLELRSRAVEGDRPHGAPSPAQAGAEAASTEAWRHLAAQQMALSQQVGDVRDAVDAVRGELAALKGAFEHLHHYTTTALKREVADYVNALAAVRAQLQVAPAVPRTEPAAPPPPAARPSRAPRAAASKRDSARRDDPATETLL